MKNEATQIWGQLMSRQIIQRLPLARQKVSEDYLPANHTADGVSNHESSLFQSLVLNVAIA